MILYRLFSKTQYLFNLLILSSSNLAANSESFNINSLYKIFFNHHYPTAHDGSFPNKTVCKAVVLPLSMLQWKLKPNKAAKAAQPEPEPLAR